MWRVSSVEVDNRAGLGIKVSSLHTGKEHARPLYFNCEAEQVRWRARLAARTLRRSESFQVPGRHAGMLRPHGHAGSAHFQKLFTLFGPSLSCYSREGEARVKLKTSSHVDA